MTIPRKRLAAVLITVLGLVAPALAGPGSIQIPDIIRKEIPSDTFLLIYTPSLEKTLAAIGKTAGTVDPQAAMMTQKGPMLIAQQLFESSDPNTSVEIDSNGPAALALGVGGGGEPSATVIIGLKGDPAGVKGREPGATVTAISGSSLIAVRHGVTGGTGLDPGSKLLQNIPSGDLSIAFDQALFVKAYAPMVMQMMDMFGSMGADAEHHDHDHADGHQHAVDPGAAMMQAQMKQSIAQLKMFMDMFQSWDAGITFDGADVSATVRWIPTDSKLNAQGSADLGTHSDIMVSGSFASVLMSKGAMQSYFSMEEGYDTAMIPAGLRPAIDAMYKLARKSIDRMGSSAGVCYGIGDKGLWFVQLFSVDNVEDYLSDVNQMMEALADSGIGVSVENLRLIDGSGKGYTLRLDFNKLLAAVGVPSLSGKEGVMMQSVVTQMLGGDVGFQMRFLHDGQKVAFVGGRNGKALGRAKQILKAKSTGVPNVLTSLVSTADGSPTLVMTMDMREMISDALSFIHSVPALAGQLGDVPRNAPAGDPVRLDLTCTARTNGGQCVISVDVGGFVQMIKAMQAQVKAGPAHAALAN